LERGDTNRQRGKDTGGKEEEKESHIHIQFIDPAIGGPTQCFDITIHFMMNNQALAQFQQQMEEDLSDIIDDFDSESCHIC